jgi:2-polyprenyl-3-methyl-5-hydroxy-6-metoxy-1,4-benzoquinol methylase
MLKRFSKFYCAIISGASSPHHHMEKNIPALWDKIWTSASIERTIFLLAKEENSIRWQRIKSIVLQEFGSFNKLRTIELGAGMATYSALMAARGAKVTIVDYSDEALKKARIFFKRLNLPARFIKQNALSLTKALFNKYDISMSFGLNEHFAGVERLKVNKAHFDVLRSGGLTFISVPNKYNPFYRLSKFFSQQANVWIFGEEYPYSRDEFKSIFKRLKIRKCNFLGDSFFNSFKAIVPRRLVKRLFKINRNITCSIIKKEHGTFLDEYLGAVLVAYGKKLKA